jgi:hypothetical protein
LRLALVVFSVVTLAAQTPWKRHTIDSSLLGADGVRLADVNGDGLPDIATGWEESRRVRIYYHPPKREARGVSAWRSETVGQVCSPEDAVFVDLDGDGLMDVVSSCEDKQPTGVYVHWAPDWKTERFLLPREKRWIYALPMKLLGQKEPVLFLGGKEPDADLLLLRRPVFGSARDLAKWQARKIGTMGWTMSLIERDMDNDGDLDVLVSDRRGKQSGIFWLEAPLWTRHEVGADGEEAMFVDIAKDPTKDRRTGDVIAAAIRPNAIALFRRPKDPRERWEREEIPYPPLAGTAKAVALGDLDNNGRLDIALTCENAEGGKEGVWWLEGKPDGSWTPHRVSGREGIKFDRIELLDIDGDGDLDLLTTEERFPLGVVWYENPRKL